MIKDKNIFLNNSKLILENMVSNLESLTTIELDSLNTEKSMHIIIDMNNGFAKKGELYSPRVEALIPNIVDLTKKALDKEMITVAYTDSHTEHSPELKSYPKHCMGNTDESELIEELKERCSLSNTKGIVTFKKNCTNGMIATNLFELRGHFISEKIDEMDTFIITGCVTDVCIYQYALTLKAYLNENNIDARVIIPINCVDTFHIPHIHDAEFMNVVFLNSMLSNGIEVVKSII